MHPVKAPVRHDGKGLGAVSVTGIGGIDPAAQLRTALTVKTIEHRLTDQLSIQADSEVYRLAVFKIFPGYFKEAALLHRSAEAAHVVIAPPAVAILVQYQSVIGGDILLGQSRESQTFCLQLWNRGDVAQQLVLRFKAVLGRELGQAGTEAWRSEPPGRAASSSRLIH